MLTRKRILIADDVRQLRVLIRAALSRPAENGEAYEVMEASNGSEALDLAMQHKPDMIILDWMMPKMTGIEVVSALMDNEETAHIPIIMLTGRGQERDKQAGLIAGTSGYVTKPFSPKQLREAVEHTFLTRAALQQA